MATILMEDLLRPDQPQLDSQLPFQGDKPPTSAEVTTSPNFIADVKPWYGTEEGNRRARLYNTR